MKERLHTRPVHSDRDIREFFEESAAEYREQHGRAEKLRRYRLRLIRAAVRLRPDDRLLDVGCGPGNHLLPLAGEIAGGVGVDFSMGMIRAARATARQTGLQHRFHFLAARAESLPLRGPAHFSAAICIGALEHMPDKPAVLREIRRVLRPGGRLAILTPNGDYIWYRKLAPRLGLNFRHLSSDRFLRPMEARELLRQAGFTDIGISHWSFVPAGDMPRRLARLLRMADWLAKWLRIPSWRGGLLLTARSD